MGKDASQIRREIEETRARMGDTVEAIGYKADVPARVKDAVNDKVETVKGTISDVVDTVKRNVGGTWSDTTDKMGDATSNVNSRVQETIGSVTDKLPSAGDVTSAARRGAGIVMENPLGLALGALAAGFLAGLAAPVTDIERKTVGPIRDDLVERAKTAGSDALEHGKQALQETAQSVVQTALQTAQNGASASASRTSEYGVLLDDDVLQPGTPGTAAP